MKHNLILAFILLVNIHGYAQVISNLPNNVANSRYYSDIFCEKRPCLTINGFKNNYASVEGILNRYYQGDLTTRNLIDTLNYYSNRDMSAVSNEEFNESLLNQNTLRLQSKALIALLQYISVKNGRNLNEMFLSEPVPSANDAIANLKLAFLRPQTDYMAEFKPNPLEQDHVKLTRSYMSFARALDLYLALENAFVYYGESDVFSTNTRLLTQHQKNSILVNAHWRSHVLFYAHEFAFGQYGLGSFEAGNRPLKILTAAGYLALTLQDISQPDQDSTLTHVPNQVLWASSAVQNALQRNGPITVPYRYNNWAYQSDGGKRFWAEGPYYLEYALLDVLPFWHAVRQMGLLQTTSNGLNTNISDPFHSDWFLNPIEWLADISTPDGMTPPLDDGNKRSIRPASLLNWDGSYGRQNIGRKYEWVRQNQENYANSTSKKDAHLYLLELVIPKTQSALAPPMLVGPGHTGTGEQQVVLRFNDDHGNRHWLLVNGEYGTSITNGEGHEQPDQLQLLYYVNDKTYIKDSGYDTGSPVRNSNWNGYYHHNGMSLHHNHTETVVIGPTGWLADWLRINIDTGIVTHQNNGGVLSPTVNQSNGHKVANHAEVNNLQVQSINSLTYISGSVELAGGTNRSTYQRNIVFVRDSSNPYIVDFNRIFRNEGEAKEMRLMYHLPYFSNYNNSTPNTPFQNMSFASPISLSSNQRLGYFVSEIESINWFGFYDVYNRDENSTFEIYSNSDGRKRVYHKLQVRELHSSVTSNEHFGINQLSTRYSLHSPKATSEKSLNTISLLAYENPNNDITRFYSNEVIQSHYVNGNIRLISWKPFSPNTQSHETVRDFAFKRKTNDPSYHSDLIYNIGTGYPSIRLKGGKEFGFIRLRLIDGIWTPDLNYRINIETSTIYFASNQNLNESVIPSGTSILIKENTILTISQPVTFESGTTVTLGTNASIVVSGSGKITADGTTFTSVNPSNPAVAFNRIELNTSGNSFTNSTFKGGNNHNVLVKQSGNTFTGCVFSHSKVGLSLFTVAAEAILIGSTITQNTQHGAYVDGGTLRLNGYTRSLPSNPYWNQVAYNPSSVHANGGNGVTLIGSGKLHTSHSRIMDNAAIQISVGNDARLYAQESNSVGDLGRNRITKETSGYYIYSTARTQSGETYQSWTIPANMNYWGAVDEPASGRFFGPVDATFKLDHDETEPSITLTCAVSDCDDKPEPGQLASILSASMAMALADGSATSSEAYHRISTKDRLLAIRNQLANRPDDPFNARLLREWHGLLQEPGASVWSDEKEHYASHLAMRRSRHATDLAARQTGSRTVGGRAGDAPSEGNPADLIGETAWVLSLADLAERGQFEPLLIQAGSYAQHILNADNRASMLTYRMQALQGLGRYGEAIDALNELERIQASTLMRPHYIAQDYGPLRHYLADLAGVDVEATYSKSIAAPEADSAPHTFALHPTYPNPFNPTTTLRYTVGGGNGSSAQVRIAVFDLLGREVAVLVNEPKPAGVYTQVFDGTGVASGIYLIHARLGTQVFSQKITLIK